MRQVNSASSYLSNISINSHSKDFIFISKDTSFNSLQDWIRDISSKLPWEKLSKEDSEAPTSTTFKTDENRTGRYGRSGILSCAPGQEFSQDRTGYTTLSCIFICSSEMNFRFEYYNTCSNYFILHRLIIIVVIIKVIKILSHRSRKMSNRKWT